MLLQRGGTVRKQELDNYAEEISDKYGGAPVVVTVGGTGPDEDGPNGTRWGWDMPDQEGQTRNVLGVLQAAIQWISIGHALANLKRAGGR